MRGEKRVEADGLGQAVVRRFRGSLNYVLGIGLRRELSEFQAGINCVILVNRKLETYT
jgi:hypothetical protein